MKKRNPNHNRRLPRHVDPYNNQADHWCIILALRGRSNKSIIRETGLSPGQISYRLKKFEVKRMEYRDGTSAFAKQVDKVTDKLAEKALLDHIRHHMKG